MVNFTHVAESVLDRVRSNQLRITSDLVAILLGVCDHLGVLISGIAEGADPDDDTHRASDELATKLRAYLGQPPQVATPANVPAEHDGTVETEDSDGVDTDNWHISLRFGPDVLRNGMDPLSFIR